MRSLRAGGWAVTGAILALLIALSAAAGSAWGSAPGVTSTPFVEPSGCLQPPDDYTRIWVNGEQFNARTIAMLDRAQVLYSGQGGIIDFRRAITQGSYNAGAVAASFGTHDGGGAVDLSVRSPVDYSILTDEIPRMIHALRIAGFAAWVREENELYDGSVIHIHAIAIGDRELSEAARAQIDGRFGYLRGYNGLPQTNGAPLPDRYGDPIVCGWMVAQGFGDMRGQPNPYPTPGGTTVPQWAIP